MKQFAFALFLLQATKAFHGPRREFQLRRMSLFRAQPDAAFEPEKDASRIDDAMRALFEFSTVEIAHSMSMSMSMPTSSGDNPEHSGNLPSDATPPFPTQPPATVPTPNFTPNYAPNYTPNLPPNSTPAATPTPNSFVANLPSPNPTPPQQLTTAVPVSIGGTVAPSNFPSTTPSMSSLPIESTTPTATSGITLQDSVLECTASGDIGVAGSLTKVTTPVELTVAYAAEALNATEIATDALDALEMDLLEAAIGAALNCSGGRRRRLTTSRRRLLTAQTDSLGGCAGVLDDSYCEVYETDLSFVVNGEIDVDQASYDAYSDIQRGMEDDTFSNSIDGLDKLTYLLPSPLVAPNETLPVVNYDEREPTSGSDNGTNYRPLTIGLGVAVAVAGLVAIVVLRRRHVRTRKEHEHLMLENGSFERASMAS
eukprot:CAMPEP_0194067136 /NCGR_PEP_ID=MMETSP0009_2-20130614/86397_1 /TAXON_ID=210454 /ORGANISM="Grammatophora oceanica, Strain CCMP 410" /LENGTH=425 /DNA_ID=CAMNT_0038720145 /DNA_START=1215 /DNA_END=2492 /DNA_ORIENTATION=-